MMQAKKPHNLQHFANLFFLFQFFYLQSASPRWEPQISVLCEAGQQYLPQYLSEDGRWTTELSVKVPGVSCLRDKMDLLDYCKKVCEKFTVTIAFAGFCSPR